MVLVVVIEVMAVVIVVMLRCEGGFRGDSYGDDKPGVHGTFVDARAGDIYQYGKSSINIYLSLNKYI